MSQSSFEEARKKLTPDVRELLDAYIDCRRQRWVVGGAATGLATVVALAGFLTYVHKSIRETAENVAQSTIEELKIKNALETNLIEAFQDAQKARSETRQALEDLQETKQLIEEATIQTKIATDKAINSTKKAVDDANIASADALTKANEIEKNNQRLTRIVDNSFKSSNKRLSGLQKTANGYQETISAFGGVDRVIQAIKSGLDDKQISEEFIQTVVEEQVSLVRLPLDVVLPFDRPGKCPEGWTEFREGAGRTIIGSGNGDGLSPRPYRDEGGEEDVELLATQVPAHVHGLGMIGLVDVQATHGLLTDGHLDVPWFISGSGHLTEGFVEGENQIMTVSGGSVNGQTHPHDNMPPYIVLRLCKYVGTS